MAEVTVLEIHKKMVRISNLTMETILTCFQLIPKKKGAGVPGHILNLVKLVHFFSQLVSLLRIEPR